MPSQAQVCLSTGIFLDEGGDDRGRGSRDDTPPPAANDNGNGDTSVRIDAAVLTIARLIGRQMAREAFEQVEAANDNDQPERRDD